MKQKILFHFFLKSIFQNGNKNVDEKDEYENWNVNMKVFRIFQQNLSREGTWQTCSLGAGPPARLRHALTRRVAAVAGLREARRALRPRGGRRAARPEPRRAGRRAQQTAARAARVSALQPHVGDAERRARVTWRRGVACPHVAWLARHYIGGNTDHAWTQHLANLMGSEMTLLKLGTRHEIINFVMRK